MDVKINSCNVKGGKPWAVNHAPSSSEALPHILQWHISEWGVYNGKCV